MLGGFVCLFMLDCFALARAKAGYGVFGAAGASGGDIFEAKTRAV
jgi:hypothetical protein